MKTPWYSSYEENNYGDFFYSLIRLFKPKKVIELGTKAGYSAYHISRGLQENGKGILYCYDLWERYPYRSVAKSVAENNLKDYKKIIKLEQRNAIGVDKLHKSVDILHIDLSNEGVILEKIVPYWIDKVCQFIILEGGSKKRDQVEWMIKYKKDPINKWLKDFDKQRGNIEYIIFEPFPSVTILRKKILSTKLI